MKSYNDLPKFIIDHIHSFLPYKHEHKKKFKLVLLSMRKDWCEFRKYFVEEYKKTPFFNILFQIWDDNLLIWRPAVVNTSILYGGLLDGVPAYSIIHVYSHKGNDGYDIDNPLNTYWKQC